MLGGEALDLGHRIDASFPARDRPREPSRRVTEARFGEHALDGGADRARLRRGVEARMSKLYSPLCSGVCYGNVTLNTPFVTVFAALLLCSTKLKVPLAVLAVSEKAVTITLPLCGPVKPFHPVLPTVPNGL
jgi:hypothetical protein